LDFFKYFKTRILIRKCQGYNNFLITISD